LKIGIIDADLIGRKKHRFPNLACMKISAYHKNIGDQVTLLQDYEEIKNHNRVYMSKVFTDTKVPDGIIETPNINYGGTGFFYDKAPPLPDEIEHIMPDYRLYDEWVNRKIKEGIKPKELAYYTDYSLGFLTRGCIRGCEFCVNKNYTKCSLHSPLSEFLDPSRHYICLLDDNVLACKDWETVFTELKLSGKRFQFKQGMDERLLTDKKCDVIFKNSKWIGDYIFAFDNIKDAPIIEKKLKLIRTHTIKIPKFYLFCGFNHDDPDHYSKEFWLKDIVDLFKRIEILMRYECLPYIMRYKDYELSPYKGMYINIGRWCNQPSFFKKNSIREFVYKADGAGREDKMYASRRYLEEFEKEHPEIAKQYFDMKFETICEKSQII